MDSDFKNLAANLAHNLIEIRQVRNLTQEALAKIVDVPRSTIANLESGEGNPSLLNLFKLSHALHIPIEKLLATKSIQCILIPSDEIEVQKRSQGDVLVYKLLPDPLPNMDIDRMEIAPGAQMRGTPHPQGTKEYLHCIQGEISVKINQEIYVVKKGDVLTFPGSVHHAYMNHGKNGAIGVSVVALTPMPI